MIRRMRAKLVLFGMVLICSASVIAADGVIVEDDFFLGVWSPYARRWQKDVPICIWSEEGDRFRIVASGLSPGQRFSVANSLGDLVRYNVTVFSGRQFRRRENLRQHVPSRRVYESSTTEHCTSGQSAVVRVKVNKGQIDRAMPAIYSDTLLIVLSPQ